MKQGTSTHHCKGLLGATAALSINHIDDTLGGLQCEFNPGCLYEREVHPVNNSTPQTISSFLFILLLIYTENSVDNCV